ncbi:MAG: Clp protease N-terminal domain-containing protein, partial [Patescibacteria group bacterium]
MEQLIKRCTQPLLRVFANAAQRALAEGNKTIEPSHLFFGLTDLSEGTKKPIKKTTKKIVASVELSKQSIQLIEQAAGLAERYSYDSVGPEHLFVSLLYHRDPAIQKMLEEHHVSTDAIKRQLVGIVDHT